MKTPQEVDEDENRKDRSDHIPEFTKQELQAAIDCLKKGKSGDTMGIKVEDIRKSDDERKGMMREIFNEVMRHESMVPEAWRKVSIKDLEIADFRVFSHILGNVSRQDYRVANLCRHKYRDHIWTLLADTHTQF